MRQCRSPSMQHQRRPDPCAQMLGVRCDGAQRFGCDLKQQTIDHRLVGVGDGADRCGQGKHHVVIIHRQQFGLTGFEPTPGSAGLTLRAMPVATRVVGDLVVRTGWAMQHMTTQRRAAALLDG